MLRERSKRLLPAVLCRGFFFDVVEPVTAVASECRSNTRHEDFPHDQPHLPQHRHRISLSIIILVIIIIITILPSPLSSSSSSSSASASASSSSSSSSSPSSSTSPSPSPPPNQLAGPQVWAGRFSQCSFRADIYDAPIRAMLEI